MPAIFQKESNSIVYISSTSRVTVLNWSPHSSEFIVCSMYLHCSNFDLPKCKYFIIVFVYKTIVSADLTDLVQISYFNRNLAQ